MKEKAVLIKICFVAAFVFASLFLFPFPLTLTHEAFAYSYSYSSSDNTAPPNLIITEIYPNTNTEKELDEYVAITNPCAYPENIEGWSITDNEGKIIFPPFSIAPGETIYVTRTASVFVEQMSNVSNKDIFPDFEYGSDSDPRVSQMQTEGRFVLSNSGDEVILQDKRGREVDVVIYGDSDYKAEEGWRAEPLRKPREEMIFKRKGIQDTNQCEDWLILTFGASYHAPERFSFAGGVTAFVSPDCSFSVLQEEMDNASSSLFINLYQFENPYLMDIVLDALNRGVTVCLLLEGSPVGGIKDAELYIAGKIKERGGEVRFVHDPFINHAKYAIIDNETLIVMTENWKNTGVPYSNSFGNRGWGIVIRNEEVASYFNAVFFEDFYRCKEFSTEIDDFETKGFFMSREIPEGAYAPVFVPLTMNCNFTVIPVLAPDTALSAETTLGAINNAKESVFVQQLSTGRFWGGEDNAFVYALIEAARRGCEVKVLLDSKYLEGENNNDEVVSWLNEVVREENLNLEAKLADLDSLGLTKIHNKGLIVDGKKVLISSLNWNANSIYNREAGVIVENEEIALFYEDVFFHDWNTSVNVEQEGGEEMGGSEEGTPTKMRIVYVVLTLIISFGIFRVVKWYKRV